MQLTIVDTIGALQETLVGVAKQGKRVALVPTMGALHEGHMTLMREAKKHADYVVASIFVNPSQFGPGEDFNQYPRRLESDLKQMEAAGVALAYTPSVADMYPLGFTTKVSAGEMGRILCGQFRPGHFDGVATVVTKLLLRVLPHVALFGEKDYQQLCLIRQVAYDLDIPIAIIGVPTVREADGLAMSSRNAYLSDAERKLAPKLYETLAETAKQISDGAEVATALAVGGTKLTSAGFTVDYLELRQSYTLMPLLENEKPARLLAAVRLGSTRLIDNIALE